MSPEWSIVTNDSQPADLILPKQAGAYAWVAALMAASLTH